MMTFDPEIVMKIWEVFPESFNVTKKSPVTAFVPGEFGVNEVVADEETVILAECIANTATAFSRNGTDMDRAMKYIEGYKPYRIQQREIRNFLKR